MTNYLVTPWALAGRNVPIWRWVQQPEVKRPLSAFLFFFFFFKYAEIYKYLK